MPNKDDFTLVFGKLKGILQKHESRLTVKTDAAASYYLDAAFSEKFKRDIFFGSVQIKKNYVSFYLMPVYMFPELLQGISPNLKKRMQGKSCFNFAAIDEETFRALALLTKKSFEKFKPEKLLVK